MNNINGYIFFLFLFERLTEWLALASTLSSFNRRGILLLSSRAQKIRDDVRTTPEILQMAQGQTLLRFNLVQMLCLEMVH